MERETDGTDWERGPEEETEKHEGDAYLLKGLRTELR